MIIEKKNGNKVKINIVNGLSMISVSDEDKSVQKEIKQVFKFFEKVFSSSSSKNKRSKCMDCKEFEIFVRPILKEKDEEIRKLICSKECVGCNIDHEIYKLKEKIEKMKNCLNCKNYRFKESVCLSCKRQFVYLEQYERDQRIDNWLDEN